MSMLLARKAIRRNRTKWFFGLSLAIAVMLLVVFLVRYAIAELDEWVRVSKEYEPQKAAVSLTEQLINEIRTSNADEPPASLPSYLLVGDSCWKLLRQSLAKNTNQYELSIIYAYDSENDPKAVHPSTEVLVAVQFPDGSKAQVFYWNGGLAGCR